jgi:hypothetical protein
MQKHFICLGLLLAGFAVSCSGCLAVAVGAGAAGTVAYLAGDIEAEEPYGIDAVYRATRSAFDELDLPVVRSDRDALSATVVSRDAEDRRITVKLKATTEGSTTISIRVGTFGDEVKSRLIYNKIMQQLQATG